MSFNVVLKWGKTDLSLEVDPNMTFNDFKEKIKTLTCIPTDKQKIMGIRSRTGEEALSALGLKPGKPLMLIGTPDGVALPTVERTNPNSTETQAQAVFMTGLPNLGNTCYLNSALQLIRTIPEIGEALAQYKGDNSVLVSLSTVLQRLNAGEGIQVAMMMFWHALLKKYPTLAAVTPEGHPMQQDAHEALAKILQEVVTVLPSKFSKLFSGDLKQELRGASDEAGSGTESSDVFSFLSCNINSEVGSIEIGLEKAFNESFSTTNETTQEVTNLTRRSRINKAPEYLLVHLVRFSWRSDIKQKTKVLKPVSFPPMLDIFTLCSEELQKEQKPRRDAIREALDAELEKRKRGRLEENVDSSEAKGMSDAAGTSASKTEPIPSVLQNETGYYELCGVISHKGRGADSGHYIYWGKSGTSWVVYDDENAAVVTEEDVLRLRGIGESHIAYVLLYRSRNPVTHQATKPY